MEKKNHKLIFDILGNRPIAFNPIFAKITGSITSALLLSQILYWWKAMGYREFYKTNEDFSNELEMGINEFKSAKNKLKKFVQIKIKGVPAKTFYKPLEENIVKALLELPEPPTSKVEINQPVGLNSTNQLAGIQPTTTENTTENTTKKNTKVISSFEKILSLSEEEVKKLPDVLRVYRLYLLCFGKTPKQLRLTDGRRNKIEVRLNNYPLEDIAKAIKNASKDDFYAGRKTGFKATLEWIMNKDENIERLRDLTPRSAPQPKPDKKILMKFEDGSEAWVTDESGE